MNAAATTPHAEAPHATTPDPTATATAAGTTAAPQTNASGPKAAAKPRKAKAPQAKPPKAAEPARKLPKALPNALPKPRSKQAPVNVPKKQAKANPPAQPAKLAKTTALAKAVKAPKATKPRAPLNTEPPATPMAMATGPVSGADAASALRGKDKLVRDSFTMPRTDHALIAQLKDRALGFRRPTKKSELLRAGLKALAALPDDELAAVLASLSPVATGRPKKGH